MLHLVSPSVALAVPFPKYQMLTWRALQYPWQSHSPDLKRKPGKRYSREQNSAEMLCLQVATVLILLCQFLDPGQADDISHDILVNVFDSEAMKYQGGTNSEMLSRVLGRSQILKLLVAASGPTSEHPWERKAERDASHENPSPLFPEEFENMVAAPLREHLTQKAYVAKRGARGPKFALSIDVPTTILSVLIDLAKAKDMRAKAAANADLMARIGR
ncbi:hypothetical protein NDU88_008277 [Pleurodeles waltl]|uniref:Corticotropin-releasing factor domain-containing protein n=1 Tax=Pleurodeles waltl TaxID=8319 RepID=A0AAV7N4H3_PLEWA|nr:hypothetical protein NDU88_008277 [Pleurodeles waltl]